jgi:hypothetical protein
MRTNAGFLPSIADGLVDVVIILGNAAASEEEAVVGSSSEEEQRQQGREDLLYCATMPRKFSSYNWTYCPIPKLVHTCRTVHFVTKFGSAIDHVEIIHPTTEEEG